jgi:hypothetical protein
LASGHYAVWSVIILALCISDVLADGIEPGLWKITTRAEANGVAAPPRESTRCLTAEQTKDLAATFSPVAQTINSECAPIERSLIGGKLSWNLVCKGQLDMELTGDFHFDSPRRYTATVRTKAKMGGMPMANSVNSIEAQWISACE